MSSHEIALTTSECLRFLPATVTVEGAIITIVEPGRTLTIEAINENAFLIGRPPAQTNEFQTQVTGTPRVQVNRAELLSRANAWAQNGN